MSLIQNKKAGLRFEILDTYAAGMELSGGEVKSLRGKHGSLEGARVMVRGGEAYVTGMTIPPYQVKNTPESYEAERPRRLLLSKKEIAELADAESKQGLTTVPLEVYNAGRYIKLKVAIVRGKGKADKREDLKRKDAKIEMERAMRRQ